MNTLATGPTGGLLHEVAAVPRSEWAVALITAVIAAMIYELVIKVVFRKITASLPFILLRLTRLMVRGDDWRPLFHEVWGPDLHDVLDTREGTAGGRYLRAMRFSLSLVFGGAIRTARQLPYRAPSRASLLRKARLRRATRSLCAWIAVSVVILAGVAALTALTVWLGWKSGTELTTVLMSTFTVIGRAIEHRNVPSRARRARWILRR